MDWHQGYARGLALVRSGTDPHAAELGIVPTASLVSNFMLGDETVFHGPLREWRWRLEAGLGRGTIPARVAAAAK